jgi:hypothetical protein
MRPVNVTTIHLANDTNVTEEVLMPTLITTDFRYKIKIRKRLKQGSMF